MFSRICLACSLALALPVTALAAEDEPAPEAEEATPPPDEPPPTAPPAPAATPPTTVRPATAPQAYPSPYWAQPAESPAAAPQADAAQAEPEPEPEPEGIVIPRWQVFGGVRTAFITTPGFDPFSENNVLVQGSIGGSRTLLSQGLFSVAASVAYDGGSKNASARGEATRLEVHRLALGPEARVHLFPIMYAYFRPSAALMRTVAAMDESATQTTLYARAWTFAFDATAGAAFKLVSFGRTEKSARLWAIGEGGYGWASSSELRLAPDDDDSAAPQRVAPVDLGSLAVRGPMFRIMIAATF